MSNHTQIARSPARQSGVNEMTHWGQAELVEKHHQAQFSYRRWKNVRSSGTGLLCLPIGCHCFPEKDKLEGEKRRQFYLRGAI